MHVVAILRGYPPDWRVGAFLATHELLTGLVAHGHTVDVFTDTDRDDVLDGVRVRPRTEAAAAGADLVVSHAGDDGTAPRLAVEAHVPFVMLVHGHHDDVTERCAGADLVVFNSHASQSEAGYQGNHVVVRPVLRPLASVTPGGHVTLVNLSEAKGGGLFWRLARAAPHVEFLGVLGRRRQLTEHAANVTVVPATAIENVFSRTRILLMPSERESWGMTGVEALSCGIPVVAHLTPGLRESLGDAGIFVDRDDGQGWLDVIERLSDPFEWNAASARARAHVSPDDRDRFIDAVEKLTGGPR